MFPETTHTVPFSEIQVGERFKTEPNGDVLIKTEDHKHLGFTINYRSESPTSEDLLGCCGCDVRCERLV
jgi:hypothetical protein